MDILAAIADAMTPETVSGINAVAWFWAVKRFGELEARLESITSRLMDIEQERSHPHEKK